MAFAHLHLHSEYSLLDGANRIKPLVKQLKSLGFTHAAITDHGVLYGVVDFYNEMIANGLTPIIGCEVYICKDRFAKHGDNRESSHLVLLCENNVGYHNLIKLVSAGFTEGFYYRPRIDYSLLQEHCEGLICLSACLSGDLSKMMLQGRLEDAKKYALSMEKMFGKGRYYIEIMDHGIKEERTVLPKLIQLSKETGIPLVATNDCHYPHQKDAAAQEVLICIQTGKTLQDEVRMRMHTDQLYVKSEAEMQALFPEHREALENTMRIAERCHVDFDFKTLHLPAYPITTGETPHDLLRRLCKEGLKERYPHEADDPESEPNKRLDYELQMIQKMGYVDYFLIVWDFIDYANKHGILVGPGRGSGAGSIVAYTLSITKLDPLQYQLLFERFLNPERMSMPDLDIDFCYERRQEVIDYVAEKYGQDHVAQIITFGTMKAKAVVRDVGRVLGMSYQAVDSVAKAIPFALDMTLEKALTLSPQLKEMVDNDPQVRQLYQMSLILEGMPRHASTHAAGVLITAKQVTEYVPLQLNDQVVTTQFPMGTLESLGLLKMDFLGLRTLTVIQDTIDMVSALGIKLTMSDIRLDDPNVYKMISKGDTDGVFQLESGGFKQFLSNMKPSCFEDIIAAISLYRPGPMDSIPRYIEGKQNPSAVKYLTPMLKPILEVTYGCMVYQEQVMQIVRDLAGYSLGRSDLMRRAMSKKKVDVMAKEREYFIHGMQDEQGNILIDGAVRRGVPEVVAEQIFDEMSAFAKYAFNKSHAAAYAMIAVQTGWLKCHYQVPFMAAMLNSVMDTSVKVAGYIQYCRMYEVTVLAPDVNASMWRFSVEKIEGQEKLAIRFGLGAIKNVGKHAVEMLISRRKEGEFTSIYDLVQRCAGDSINKRTIESLIKAGAMDKLGHNRAQLLSVYELLIDDVTRKRRDNVPGQLSMFDLLATEEEKNQAGIPIPPMNEHPMRALLNMEKETTGVYISGHPLDEVKSLLNERFTTVTDIERIQEEHVVEEQRVSMAGILVQVKARVTKKGSMMGVITLEDMTGQIEGVVFPKVYEKTQFMLETDAMVVIEGRVSFNEDEEVKLFVEDVKQLTEKIVVNTHGKIQRKPNFQKTDAQWAKEASTKLYLLVEERSALVDIKLACEGMPGDVPVYVKIQSEGIALLLERSYWCSPTEMLLGYFRENFGVENVVLK